MRALLLALVASASGCSAVLNFRECDTSKDCEKRMVQGGAPLYCNSDHQCIDTTPCRVSVEATAMGTPLVVAGLYKTSGPSAVNDHSIRQAADLAAAELNSNLMVPIRHVVCDTAGDQAQAVQALKIAVEQFHAVAIVGPDTSGEVIAVAPLVTRYGVAMVSPSATNPAISGLMDNNLIWRTCPSDNLQAKVLAQLVPSMAKLDIVWVHPNTYADGLEQAFIQASNRGDAKTITFDTGGAASVVAKMDAPAYALLIADTDAPDLVQALKNAPGQSATQYLMTDSALAPTLWGAAPYDFRYLNRILGTAPALPAFGDPSGPVYAAFASNYKTAFAGEDPANTAFVANAFDAFYVIAMAANAAGSRPTGAAIAANLARMNDPANGTTVRIGLNDFPAGVRAIATAGGSLNVIGASGPINFDSSGDLVTAPFEVWQVVSGTNNLPTFRSVQVITP